ncbi:MAG: hypothetical protein ACFFBH_07255 [Promethearchaeota archaeon]
MVKLKNSKIRIIEIKTNQLINLLEKNSIFAIRGIVAVIVPTIIKIEGNTGDIRFNCFNAIVSKTHPIKTIVNPMATTDDTNWNSFFDFIENHINIILNIIILIKI